MSSLKQVIENINHRNAVDGIIVETLKTGVLEGSRAIFWLAGEEVQSGCPCCTFRSLGNLLKFVQYAKHVFGEETEICIELEQEKEFYAHHEVVEIDKEFCRLERGWLLIADIFKKGDDCMLVPTFKGIGPTWLARGRVLAPINTTRS